MQAYVESEVFSLNALVDLHRRACMLVATIPAPFDPSLRCHELARAVAICIAYRQTAEHRNRANTLDPSLTPALIWFMEEMRNGKLLTAPRWVLNVVDGQVGPIEHSWIVASEQHDDGHVKRYLLDPYCPGRVPAVQLIDLNPAVSGQYVGLVDPRTDIDWGRVGMLTAEMLMRFERARERERELEDDHGR